MNQNELIAYYEQRQSNYAKQLLSINKRIYLISNLRLATALALLVFLYFTFTHVSFFYIDFPLLVTFALLVRRHSELFNEKLHLENLLTIHKHEIQGLKGDISCFINGLNLLTTFIRIPMISIFLVMVPCSSRSTGVIRCREKGN